MTKSEYPSTTFSTGPSWRGLDALKYLVIFGASYCDVGYDYTTSPTPTREEPLGIRFPGVTYAEPNEPNWVGLFVTNHSPNPNLLVYNYSKGGSRVYNVKSQVEEMFLRHFGNISSQSQWTSSDTLFMTWVGINDAAWSCDHVLNVQKLFEIQETLYQSGARNFLFFNLSPIHRSPAKGKLASYSAWNIELKNSASHFITAHADATVMIFSSWDTFTAVLDNPVAHGFPAEDVKRQGGSIWVDHLHPTSKMHDYIARDLSTFLCSQPAFNAKHT
ncbi:hypothetical protein C8J57DRAFT_1334618 [Mycena rebaudengoi]|nr:hypothetical protein C8J57DRAFT_1334618 [Mycena rebaudengoi]